jgi:uncharacterized membrane protein YhaH (DUF805 family)
MIVGLLSFIIYSFISSPTIFLIIIGVITFYLFICLNAQRLHDLGMSSFWTLLFAVPFVGDFFIFFISSMPGKDEANEYGEISGYNIIDIVICVLFLILAIVLGYIFSGNIISSFNSYSSYSLLSK